MKSSLILLRYESFCKVKNISMAEDMLKCHSVNMCDCHV